MSETVRGGRLTRGIRTVAALAKDPAAGKISPLKVGPLRKAELFEQYAEKHRRCRQWLEGGHRERFLREFEKQCQRRFETETR